jgi:ankyrin repeat protein
MTVAGANGRRPAEKIPTRNRRTDARPRTKYRLNHALFNAAASGNVDEINDFIRRGADVNFRNREGETPLAFAAVWNQPQAAKLLLANGADPNALDRTGGTPLMLAAQHASPNLVRLLLNHAANPGAKDLCGYTALNHADWRGEKDDDAAEAIRALIHHASKAVTAPKTSRANGAALRRKRTTHA